MATIDEIRGERDINIVELMIRRFFSGIFYWKMYRWLHPSYPYYVPGAMKRLKTLLNRKSVVFEWGSGMSTKWFADQCESLVSVEHDERWYSRVSISLVHHENCKLLMIAENKGFEEYVRVIDQYPDKSFDLVAVDGRDRIECVRHAISKVKPGGYLLLDDSHRRSTLKYIVC
jgi:predicted O-methyltransferase YrrM